MTSSLFDFLHQIVQFVINGDKAYFFHINQEWTNSWFDSFMPFITDPHQSWPLVALVLLFILYKKKAKGFSILLGCIIAVGLSDLVAARVVKPMVQRDRPEQAEKKVRLLVPHQGSFGFPSNHAANMFAAATFLTCTIPTVGLIAIPAAITVAYSRIYVGVHYPMDVFCGGLIGMFIALFVFRIYLIILEKVDPIRQEKLAPQSWEKRKFKKANR